MVHHARPRVVEFGGPVAARALGDDVGQHLRIEPVGHAQRQRFGGAGHQDAQQHVVADLGHLAGAGGTGVENVLAHFLEHGARTL
ncbi:hypothetical protein D3C77_708880 [compost metagenome]